MNTKVQRLLILILGFGFMQVDPQFTIELLICINFTHVFNQIKFSKLNAYFKKILGCEFI